jgi:hypothetical protein
MQEVRNICKVSVGKACEERTTCKTKRDGKVVLKWMSEQRGRNTRAGYIWVRISYTGWLL